VTRFDQTFAEKTVCHSPSVRLTAGQIPDSLGRHFERSRLNAQSPMCGITESSTSSLPLSEYRFASVLQREPWADAVRSRNHTFRGRPAALHNPAGNFSPAIKCRRNASPAGLAVWRQALVHYNSYQCDDDLRLSWGTLVTTNNTAFSFRTHSMPRARQKSNGSAQFNPSVRERSAQVPYQQSFKRPWSPQWNQLTCRSPGSLFGGSSRTTGESEKI